MKSSNYDSLMQIMGKKRKDLQEIKEKNIIQSKENPSIMEISSQNQFLTLSNFPFSYESLEDKLLQKELKEKEKTLKNIFSHAYTQIGKTLKESQDLLASHDKNKGFFESWYTSLGFKKDSVYRLISRFNLLANCEEKEKKIIEIIPLSLAYEISKPSCPDLLKEEVLKGEIKTLKEFKEKQRNLLEDSFYRSKKLSHFGFKELQEEKKEISFILNEIKKNTNFKKVSEEKFIEVYNLFKKVKNNLKKINKILE